MGDTQKRKAALETGINILSRALASGPEDVPSSRAAIVEWEKEIRDRVTKVATGKEDSVKRQIGDRRKFVREASATSEGCSPESTRTLSAFAKNSRDVDSITLLPEGEEIRNKGQWKRLGDRECAEGPNRTQRFTTGFQIKIAA